jgi:hypothetical protein
MDIIIFLLSVVSIGLICAVYWVISGRITDLSDKFSCENDKLKTVITGVAEIQKQLCSQRHQPQQMFYKHPLETVPEYEYDSDESDESSDVEEKVEEPKHNFVFPSSKKEALIIDNELMDLYDNDDEDILEEKDDLFEEKDDLLEEKDDLLEEKDDLFEEKDDLLEEKDDLLEEKDDLFEENDNAPENKNTMKVDIYGMSLVDLKKYASTINVSIPNKIKKNELIKLLEENTR